MRLFKIFSIAVLATMSLVSCKSDDDPVEESLPEETISGTTVYDKTERYEDIDFTRSTHNDTDSATDNVIFDNTENIVWD